MADNGIVGIWNMVAIERPGADGALLRNEGPHGFLLYDAGGWFAEAFSFTAPDGSAGGVQYCGNYEVEGDTVFHIPAMHADPANVGKRLPRQFIADGDRFTLIAGAVRIHCERLR
ncbi:MAG TPA: hypothetical protein DEU95_00640 [Chloroflexi bacterium]|jgi:hypothetical protein|nr:hypothetical protein [Chloroflexota bacterium]HRA32046.1 hypothetical protein [Thermomicrobiales bacterium]